MDGAFRRGVLERLRTVDGIAHAGPDLPVLEARTQLRRITAGWRELLTEHQPDAAGRCPVCAGWWLRRKWPCQVWATAHHQLIGDISDGRQPSPDGRQPIVGVPQPRSPLRSSCPCPRDVEIIDRRVGAPERTRVDVPPRRLVTPQQPETARIHRAAVIDRYPAVPRPRLPRRPRG